MSDDASATLKAFKAASENSRWRLLKHAIEIAPFLAEEAAGIAGLAETSGNARTTHAEGLLRAGVLRRVSEKPVTYAATELGERIYDAVSGALGQKPAPTPKRVVLRRGQSIQIQTPTGRGARLFELARRS